MTDNLLLYILDSCNARPSWAYSSPPKALSHTLARTKQPFETSSLVYVGVSKIQGPEYRPQVVEYRPQVVGLLL